MTNYSIFKKDNYGYTLLATVNDEDDNLWVNSEFKNIMSWVVNYITNALKFEPYYYRFWFDYMTGTNEQVHECVIDYGSHSQFITFCKSSEYHNWHNKNVRQKAIEKLKEDNNNA